MRVEREEDEIDRELVIGGEDSSALDPNALIWF